MSTHPPSWDDNRGNRVRPYTPQPGDPYVDDAALIIAKPRSEGGPLRITLLADASKFVAAIAALRAEFPAMPDVDGDTTDAVVLDLTVYPKQVES